MNDNEVIRRACTLVGWRVFVSKDGQAHIVNRDGYSRSINDLAEEVRKYLMARRRDPYDTQYSGWGNPSTWALFSGVWMANGPIKFLAVALEILPQMPGAVVERLPTKEEPEND